MRVREFYINQTKGHRFGNSGWYTPWTTDKGRLFTDFQKEFGRCTGKMGCDYPDRTEYPVGWVFEKKMEYEDARPSWSDDKRYYIREVWVHVDENNSIEETED